MALKTQISQLALLRQNALMSLKACSIVYVDYAPVPIVKSVNYTEMKPELEAFVRQTKEPDWEQRSRILSHNLDEHLFSVARFVCREPVKRDTIPCSKNRHCLSARKSRELLPSILQNGKAILVGYMTKSMASSSLMDPSMSVSKLQGAQPTSRKQIKRKWNRISNPESQILLDCDRIRDNESAFTLPEKILRKQRVGLLAQTLANKTVCGEELGKALVFGYIKREMKRDPTFADKFKSCLETLEDETIEAQAESETSHGTNERVQISVQEGTAITEQSILSKNKIEPNRDRGYSDMASASGTSDIKISRKVAPLQPLSQLSERWLRMEKVYEWTSDKKFGDTICFFDLPYVALEENKNSINYMPYSIHRFMRSDMLIHIMVNSNKFQVGQIQCSWFYKFDENEYEEYYDNVFSASQRNHCLIDAGAGNSGTLFIKYWNPRSKLSCQPTLDDKNLNASYLSLGRMVVKVIAPLQTTDTVAKKAFISVAIAFKNPEFVGPIDRGLEVEAQMEGIVEQISTVVDTMDLDTEAEPSDWGRLTFGENVKSLKEYCRRYQNLGCKQIKTVNKQSECISNIQPILRILCHPQKVLPSDKSMKEDSRANKLREGPISICQMGYVGYRGGLRYKIIITTGEKNVHFAAIHKFDEMADFGNESVISLPPSNNPKDYLDPGYSMAYQNASVNNILEIEVPWYKPGEYNLGCHSSNLEARSYFCSLGYIYVYVANVKEDVNIGIDVFYSVADDFVFSNFQGFPPMVRIDPYAVEAQMEEASLLVNTAESFLNIVKKPLNMDNPIESVTPMVFQPVTSHSFCVVNNQNEKVQALRSDPVAQTPALVENDGEEMKLENLLSRWSLLDTFQWQQDYPTGTLLWYMPVMPLMPNDQYTDYEIRSVKYRNYPILAIISSLFAMWRGGIEVRIDIVASQFHTGRLQLSLVPGCQSKYSDKAQTKSISMNVTKNSIVSMEDISEVRQIKRNLAYYNNVPWANVPYGMNNNRDEKPPSYFFVHVLNPLIPMDNVAKSIQCNVYIRAGKNFELFGLRTCILTPPFRAIKKSKSEITYVDSSWPQMFVANSRQFPSGGSERASFFDSETTDYFTQFVNFKFGKVYKVPTEKVKVGNKEMFFRVQYYDGTTLRDVGYFVRAKQYPSYPVALLFKDFASANYYLTHDSDLSKAITTTSQGPWAQVSEDDQKKTWRSVTRNELPLVPFESVSGLLGEAQIEAQMEYIKSFFQWPAKLSGACDYIQQATGEVGKSLISAAQSVGDAVKNIAQSNLVKGTMNFGKDLFNNCKNFALLLLTNLVNIITHPTKTTIGIAVAVIMISLFASKIKDLFNSILNGIGSFYAYLFGKNKRNTTDEPEAQGEEDKSPFATFASLLWTIAGSIVGFVVDKPKSMFQFTCGLFKQSGNMFRQHVFGVKFFRDVFEACQRMWNWINVKLGRKSAIYTLVQDDKKLKKWLVMSEMLLAPENETLVQQNSEWTAKLFENQVIGRLFYVAASDSAKNITSPLVNVISSTYNKLTKRVKEINLKGRSPFIRMPPFIIWIQGPPGVGKSKMTNHIVNMLSSEFKVNDCTYTHSGERMFFDGFDTQDFIILDDFLASVGQNFSEVSSFFLQVANESHYQLPRANVELMQRSDQPKFVIVSTNKSNGFHGVSPSITDLGAFDRRVGFWIKMSFADCNDANQDTAYLDYKPNVEGETKKQYGKEYEHANISYSFNKVNWKKESYTNVLRAISVAYQQFLEDKLPDYLHRLDLHEKKIVESSTEALSFKDYFEKIGKAYNLTKEDLEVKDDLEWLSKDLLDKYIEKSAPVVSANPVNEEEETAKGKIESIMKLNLASPDFIKGLSKNVDLTINEIERFKQLVPTASEDEIRIALSAGNKDAVDVKKTEVICAQGDGQEDFTALVDSIVEQTVEMPPMSDKFIDVELMPNIFSSTVDSKLVKCYSPAFFLANDVDSYLCNNLVEGSVECVHWKLNVNNVCSYRLKKDSESYRQIESLCVGRAPPEYLLVDMHYTNPKKSVICFDTPCYDHKRALIVDCPLVAKNTLEKGRSIMKKGKFADSLWLNVYKNTIKHGLVANKHLQGDFEECSDVAQNFISKENYLTYVKPVLKITAEASQTTKVFINSLIKIVSCGFVKECLTVNNIKHCLNNLGDLGIYSNREVQRSRGLVFDDVTYESRSAAGITQEVKREPSQICNVLLILGLVICLLSYILLFFDFLWNFVNIYSLLKTPEIEPQIGTSGDIKTVKSKGSTIKALTQKISEPQVEELRIVEPISNLDGVLKKIRNNVFWLLLGKKNEEGKLDVCRKARCLGLYNNKALVITHYLDMFKHSIRNDPSLSIYVYFNHTKTYINLDILKLPKTEFETGGYCIVDIPIQISPFKNIVKYMPHEGIKTYPSDMFLVEFDIEGNQTRTNLNVRLKEEILNIKSSEEYFSWDIDHYFEYSYGDRGVCGSVLINPSSNTPLVGIHTCGQVNKRAGFSEILLQESFISKSHQPLEFVTPQMEADSNLYQPQGPHVVIGHVEKGKGVMTPNKSKIIPSDLHGIWESNSEPAPLTNKDERLPVDFPSPLHFGVEKRCAEFKNFNSRDLSIATEDFKNKVLSIVKPSLSVIQPLGLNEAICGIKDVPFIDPMELKTSEGYPWVLSRPPGYTDKRWMFNISYEDNYPRCLGINKKLFDVLDLNYKLRSQRLVPFSVYTACLKDHRILKEKITVPGKTRLFEMSPVELTIDQRRYFTPFYSAYQSARLDIEHTIGINVCGSEWTDLANRLNRFSPYILAGDYSNYGPQANLEVLHNVVDIHIEWLRKYGYGADDLLQCEMLKYQVLHAGNIIGRYICRYYTGMASGNAATVILNSGVNSIYIRLAWLDIMRRTPFNGMDNFTKFVLLFSNGDDVIMSVKPEVIKWFNNKSLQLFFDKYNIKYTNSKKDYDCVEYEKLDEVQYLKCNFKAHPFRQEYLAALDFKSISDAPLWIWKSDKCRSLATAENVDQSIRLMYGHGQYLFEDFKQRLLKHCSNIDIYVPVPSWDDLDNRVFDLKENIYLEIL